MGKFTYTLGWRGDQILWCKRMV